MNIQTSCLIHYTLLCLSFLCSSLSLADIPEFVCTKTQKSDWIPSADPDSLCGGYYQEIPHPNLNPTDQKVHISSESGGFSPTESHFEGRVEVQQGQRQLFADKILILRKGNTLKAIKAIDNITITEPGSRLNAQKALLVIKNNRLFLEQLDYKLYKRHARGTARYATSYNQNNLDLEKASYTTCAPCDNFWLLKAKSVRFNKHAGRGVARDATIQLYGVPVFYTPYLSFPIDNRRKTGFLYPIPSSSKRSGLGLSLPFYWNIAPNYDAILTPRLLSKRGIELQTQFRYLLPQHAGILKYNVLPQDKVYRRFKKTQADTRFGMHVKEQAHFNNHWSGEIEFNQVSDDNYFSDLGENLDTSNTSELLQFAKLSYQNANWEIFSRLQRYKALFPDQGVVGRETYQLLPQLDFVYQPDTVENDLIFSAKGQYTHFRHAFPQNYTTGDRLFLKPALSYPMISAGAFLKPRIQLNLISYDLHASGTDQLTNSKKHPTHLTPIFDLDSGLIFERPLHLEKKQLIQTLEPRLYYLKIPYKNQSQLPLFDTGEMTFDFNQLFRANRFSGYDRLNDADQATLGITSRFFDHVNGMEKFKISVGQIFYFRSQKVTLAPEPTRRKRSDYALEMNAQIADYWQMNYETQFNPYQKKIQKHLFLTEYMPNDSDVYHVGYQYLATNHILTIPIHQLYCSIAKRISQKWRIIGKYHHDLKQNLAQSTWAGVEYNGCCSAIRFMVSRFLQPNSNLGIRKYETAVHIQFILKGLTSVGAKGLDAQLQRDIPGYRFNMLR